MVAEFVSSGMRRSEFARVGFEVQHSGLPSEAEAVHDREQANFFGRLFGAGGVGGQEIADERESTCGLAGVLPGGPRIEVHPDSDTSTFERLVGIPERAKTVFGRGPLTRIYLAAGVTDMHRGFEGAYGLVRDCLSCDR